MYYLCFELNACTNLVVDCARSILLDAGTCPLRIEALVAGDDKRVGHCSIEAQVLAAKLVEEVLLEGVAECDVLHLQE